MSRASTRAALFAVAFFLLPRGPLHAQRAETGGALSAPRPDQRVVAVVDAATFGIDPVVGEHVTTRVQLTAQELGYLLAASDEVRATRVRLGASEPPSPADLWRLGFLTHADRVIAAHAHAENGRYVVEVMVASLDGTGPFRARAYATAEDLHFVVAGLVRQILPPTTVWDAATAAELRARATQRSPVEPSTSGAPESAAEASPTRSRHPGRRFAVALTSESAIGAGEAAFYNHLLGVRFNLRITRAFILGAYFAYANLRARNGRADNLLAGLVIEDRVDVVGVDGLTVPLRGFIGYLPFNGPVARLSAGVNYAFTERFELGADVLAPTFWITPDRRLVSFNLGLEGIFRF